VPSPPSLSTAAAVLISDSFGVTPLQALGSGGHGGVLCTSRLFFFSPSSRVPVLHYFLVEWAG